VSEVRLPSRLIAVAAAAALLFVGGAGGFVLGKGRPPGAQSVDVGFLHDMISHHEQAVALSNLELAYGVEGGVRLFAQEIALKQSYEIGLMEAFLEDWGHQRLKPPARAMRWMGMDTARDAMLGMASPGDLEKLGASRGRDADALFIALMKDHHEGGVHMAEYAADRSRDAKIRDLAMAMAKTQRDEIVELERERVRLDLPAR
jgi:uncharacterized protein (DUF305 family)